MSLRKILEVYGNGNGFGSEMVSLRNMTHH